MNFDLPRRAFQRMFDADTTNDTKALSGATRALLTPAELQALGQGVIQLSGHRTLSELLVYGTDAADEAADIDVYAIDALIDGRDVPDNESPDSFLLRRLGNLAPVLSTAAGDADSYVSDSHLFADALVWTPDATVNHAAWLASVFGGAFTLSSPAANNPECLSTGDIGDMWGVFFDVTIGTCASLNLLYKLGA